jgi:HK97 family phage prohead protease
MRTFLEIDKFHELAQTGEVPGDVLLRKQMAADVEVSDDDSREVLFTISTDHVDRSGDSISVDGWDLESYRKNPVILWAHNPTQLPVGRAVKVYTEGKKLKSIAQFTDEQLSPFGYTVYRFYRAKFLNAVSVGFNPTKYAFVDSNERRGVDFESQELLEYSAVPVPCNPQALMDKGVDLSVDPLIEWATGVIKEHLKPELKTVRDIEHFLRDVAGFSRSEAKTFAKPSWEASQRDVDAATNQPDLETVKAQLQALTNQIHSRRLTWQIPTS